MSDLVVTRDWDYLIIVYGRPKMGKSYYAFGRAKEIAQAPAYFLVHDPRWGLKVDKRPRTMAEFEAIMATNPTGSIAIPTADGDEACAIAMKVGRASQETKNKRPVIMLFDEGVAVKGLSQHRLGDGMRDLMSNRRHHNVGIIITSQSPCLTHHSMFALATEIVIFRLSDSKSLAKLETAGVPPEMIKQVPNLPPRKYLVFEP